jgi:hypothetical protein
MMCRFETLLMGSKVHRLQCGHAEIPQMKVNGFKAERALRSLRNPGYR